jgi:ABC-type antimicrobial peptide transport system permease subunit
VLTLVIRQSGRLVIVGTAIGIVVAAGAVGILDTLLYGIHSRDVETFVVVPVFLAAVAFGAAFVPARRATQVDPIIAMRAD